MLGSSSTFHHLCLWEDVEMSCFASQMKNVSVFMLPF